MKQALESAAQFLQAAIEVKPIHGTVEGIGPLIGKNSGPSVGWPGNVCEAGANVFQHPFHRMPRRWSQGASGKDNGYAKACA